MVQDTDIIGCSLSCWNGSSLCKLAGQASGPETCGVQLANCHEAVSAVNLRSNASAASNDWQWHIA